MKTRKLFLMCLLILLSLFSTAQAGKEYNIWYFGQHAGLDFNSGVPVELSGGQIHTWEGCATVSDNEGNLLFYTDGSTVYNRNHQIMPNGEDLMGDSSSSQSALIVMQPGDSEKYYVFTTGTEKAMKPFCYSTVSLNLDDGKGDVIDSEKNIYIYDTPSEKLTGTLHKNERDVWVVMQTNKEDKYQYRSYLITESGFSHGYIEGPTLSPLPNYYGAGYLCISPDGKFGGASQYYLNTFDIFRFDSETGQISDLITIDLSNHGINTWAYGVAFSPDSKKFYISSSKGLFSYDISSYNEDDIIDSYYRLDSTRNYAAMQLAADNKIYTVKYKNNLSVINFPNLSGSDCNFQSVTGLLNPDQITPGLPARPIIPYNIRVRVNARTYCCEGDTVVFESDVFGNTGDIVYKWMDSDSKIISEDSGLIVEGIMGIGKHQYSLEVIEPDNNYKTTKYFEINVLPWPVADAGDDCIICRGDSITIGNFNTESCTWSAVESPANPFTSETTISPDNSQTYYLRVMNIAGCEAFDTVYVEVKDIQIEFNSDIDTLIFNTVCPNSSSELEVSVHNSSAMPTPIRSTLSLPIFSIESGIFDEDFAPNEERSFIVQFNAPNEPGRYEGLLKIIDECGREKTLFLIGYAKELQVEINPMTDTLHFKSLCPNISAELETYVRNYSTSPTSVISTISNPVFSFDKEIFDSEFEPEQKRTFMIRFNAQSDPGKYEGLFSITDDCGREQTIVLIAEVKDIQVEIGPVNDTLNYNIICPNVGSSMGLFVQNLSTVNTHVSCTISEPLFEVDKSVFYYELEPDEKRYFPIHFNAQANPGIYEGQFTITDECGKEHTIYLIAEVKDIEYSIPATVDFGEICPGEIGDFFIELENMTDGILDFEIDLDRDDLFELPPTDLTVDANTNKSISMRLKSDVPRGIQRAILTVKDPCDEIRLVEITVNIKDIKFSFPDTLNFGRICIGKTAELNLSATNISNYASELVSNISNSESKFNIIDDYNGTIDKNETAFAKINFSSSSESLYIDSVLITDDCGNVKSVVLKVETVVSQLQLESIDLAATMGKGGKYEKDIIFRNIGSTNIIVSETEIDSPFEIVNLIPALNQICAPGEIVTVEVEYQSVSSGTFSGNLTLRGTSFCDFAETAGMTAIIPAASGRTEISIACPADTKNAGEYIYAPIKLSSPEDVNISGASQYVMKLIFDATVLYPEDPNQESYIQKDNIGELVISGTRNNTTADLKTIRFIAALGEHACSDLEITEFSWLDGDCDVDALHTGCLCVNICREGGDRLIKIIDNHVGLTARATGSGRVEIEYELIENSATELKITDIYGRSRDISIDATKGLHNVSIDALAAGVYIVSLRALGMLFVFKVIIL